MLDKHRVLAITKCDLLDDELIEMLRDTLPQDLPCVFISAVANKGLDELKDVLWRELNAESNKLAAGKKSYAISMILQDNEKTLNDKQIDAIMNKIIKNLETQLGAKLR